MLCSLLEFQSLEPPRSPIQIFQIYPSILHSGDLASLTNRHLPRNIDFSVKELDIVPWLSSHIKLTIVALTDQDAGNRGRAIISYDKRTVWSGTECLPISVKTKPGRLPGWKHLLPRQLESWSLQGGKKELSPELPLTVTSTESHPHIQHKGAK